MLECGQKCLRCGTKESKLESQKAMVKEWDHGGVVVIGNDKVQDVAMGVTDYKEVKNKFTGGKEKELRREMTGRTICVNIEIAQNQGRSRVGESDREPGVCK